MKHVQLILAIVVGYYSLSFLNDVNHQELYTMAKLAEKNN